MSRTFACARVSKFEQQPENQIKEINDAGFKVLPSRIVTEKISGSTFLSQRKGFIQLLDRMEEGNIVVV